MPVAVSIALCSRQEPGLLNFPIHAGLEHGMETAAFGLDLVQVSHLGAQGDRILVGAVAGEAQLLAVVGF